MTRKLFWENPYLHEADGSIVKKEKKDGKFYITLDKTIFYPDMSGGQPGDIGNINGEQVLETLEDGGNITHVLNSDIKGPKVHMSIDSNHRFDLMQQHTGQHLLSGVLFNLFDGETISFHLGKDYSTIDVSLNDFTIDEINKAEILCNKIIQSNFQVKSYFVHKEEVKLLPVRKAPTVEKDIRVVEIDGFDFSPCGGTHINHTGELGLIKISKWEHYKGNFRIQFLCGQRAIMDYGNKFAAVRYMAGLLSSSDDDIQQRFDKVLQDKLSLERDNKSLKEELVAMKSLQLVENSIEINGFKVIMKLYDKYDFKELSHLGSHISNQFDKVIQIFGISNDGLGQFIISKSRDIDLDLASVYKELSNEFKLKGGGNPNTVQGSVSSNSLPQLLDSCLDKIKNKIV